MCNFKRTNWLYTNIIEIELVITKIGVKKGMKLMLPSLGIIFMSGLIAGYACKLIKLPSLIGMLVAGIALNALGLLNYEILEISPDLRQLALVIILIRAGLSLSIADVKKVGRAAVLMSFVPAIFEITGYVIFAPIIFGITTIEAAIMGGALAAVSPAVIVPRMVKLMDEGKGTKQGIPQLIMAGSSCDDIMVIVLFTTFTGIAMGGAVHVIDIVHIPLSIAFGAIVGAVVGTVLSKYLQKFKLNEGIAVIIVLSVSLILLLLEDLSISPLIAIMTMAILLKAHLGNGYGFARKFGELWLAAELLLFILVGASVDITYTLHAGASAVLIILLALCFRSVGVLVCLLGTHFTFKEKLFCVIAYLPKATVQAAIGGLALSMGLECGTIVLSVAVVGIILTAPLGAILIDATKDKLLD